MRRLFMSVIIIFLIACFSGCQETPKEDFVKNKKEQDLEQELKAGQVKEESAQMAEIRASFPEHYQDEFELDGVSVQIDAKIDISDIETIVSEKVKPAVMPLEHIKKMIYYFVGDTECYPLGVAGSKEELMDSIISLKQQISMLESGSDLTINEGDGAPEEQLESLKEQLKEHEELYLVEEDDQSVSVEKIDFDENGAIELQSNLGRAEAARLFFYDDPDRGTRVEFMNYSPSYNDIDDNPPIEISEEKAINKAAEVIQELGLGALSVMGIEQKSQVVDGEIIGFYDISYKRELGGLQNLQLEEAAVVQTDLDESAEEYIALMGQTKENIQIDDTGIIGMNVTMAPQVIERLSDNIAICDFDQMKQYLASNIAQKSWKIPGEKRYLKITQIYLSAMYVINKNNNQEYLTVPVWDFCGYAYPESIPESSLHNLEKIDKESIYKTTYLTFNAIDGSIVSRTSGY